MNDFKSLLKQGQLTGAAAARIAGVSDRTIRRWTSGKTSVPHDAWVKIQAHIEKQKH